MNNTLIDNSIEALSMTATLKKCLATDGMSPTMEGDVLLDTGCFYPDFQRTRNPRGIGQSFKNKCFIIVWTYAT